MKKAFHVYQYDGVPTWKRDAIGQFADWLCDQSPVRHTIEVYMVNRTCLPTDDGRRCWAFFNGTGRRPTIVISCRRPVIKGRVLDRNKGISHMLWNFAHEFVHYEQWRDGRSMNERGVNQRARALVDRFHSFVTREAA